MARFTDYYSLFSGPRVISTINEPWGAFTCRSSTLAVFADFSPFHGLLLTVLAPRPISTIDEHQGAFTCRSATLAVLARIMDYYSTFWCLRVIFMADEPQGAFTCRSATLAVLADSGPYHGLLLRVLVSQRDFHGL